MLSLLEMFDALPLPPMAGASVRYATMQVEGYEHHRIAKDARGLPALLISTSDILGQPQSPPVVLENLSIRRGVPSRTLQTAGLIEHGQYTIVSCTTLDRTLHVYFLRVARILLSSLGALPSNLEVTTVINRLTELFRAMAMAPRKSIRGLWAELFLIAQAPEPALLVRSWHTTPAERYDFSFGNNRLEVKGTAGRVRHHHFSFEQLTPPIGTELLVASMYVERLSSGISLFDLLDLIRMRVGDEPSLLLHLEQVIALTLGDGWHQAHQERYDRQLAEESLAYFHFAAIPKVADPLPPGVSEVHFKSDLTGVQQANRDHFRTRSEFFRAALSENNRGSYDAHSLTRLPLE